MTRGRPRKKTHKRVDAKDTKAVVEKILPSEVDNIHDLPKPAKVAIVQTMKEDLEYSYRQISDVLGISTNTAMQYVNAEIDSKMLRFRDAVKEYMFERNATLNSLASDALEVKLKDVDNQTLRDIVGAYKVINDVGGVQRSSATNTGNVMTINVHPAVSRDNVSHNVVVDADTSSSA